MKAAIWTIFSLVTLVWTGGAFMLSEFAGWAAGAIASGEAANLGRSLAEWPIPQWAAFWVDPALVQTAQSAMLWAVDALRDALPMIGSAVGWLVPLVWVVWGLGLGMLLLIAGGAHLLSGRSRTARLSSR